MEVKLFQILQKRHTKGFQSSYIQIPTSNLFYSIPTNQTNPLFHSFPTNQTNQTNPKCQVKLHS